MTWGPWRPWGQHGVETTETTETTAMGTTWGPSEGYGDDVGTTGTTWGQHGDNVGMTWGRRGQRGDHRDNEITKNAITFERTEIIEFCLKIWDSSTLSHTCRLQLMCRWGGVLSQMVFLCKKCSGDPQKKIFVFFALDPLDHI